MKRAPTLLDMDIAAESPYHWIFSGAVGTVLGGDLVLGHGVRAAGGGTGNGVGTGIGRPAAGGGTRIGTGIGSATIPTPLPVTRLPPPAARTPSSGIWRPAAGSRAMIGGGRGLVSGASGRGACWLMRTE